MSRLWWITYCDPVGRPLGALIWDSSGLIQPRFLAVIDAADQGAEFCEGHELDDDSAALVPLDSIGRLLDLKEAGKIIRRLERGISKRSAAASVRRRGSVRARR